MKRIRGGVAAGLLAGAMLALAGAAAAQGITTAQADELLRQNRQVLDELKQIRQLLERQQPAPSSAVTAPARVAAAPPAVNNQVRISIPPDERSLGRADAPVTLVEFTDYQCPFCRQFHTSTFETLRKNYIDTGKLRYVSRDMPLVIHEHAPRAALAAHCAGEQGKFWEMRHVMILNANALQPEKIGAYAAELMLDGGKLDACIASGKYQTVVDRDMAEARTAGISGTPSFVVARTTKDALTGARIVGALPYAMFEARIKELLAERATD